MRGGKLIVLLAGGGHEVLDFCDRIYDENDDHPDFAIALAGAVAPRDFERGILICRNGIGASVAANRVKGVRTEVCHDNLTSRQSVESLSLDAQRRRHGNREAGRRHSHI